MDECSVKCCHEEADTDGLCALHHRKRAQYGTCTIEGCEKAISRPALGWCEMHYYRQYRHGSVEVETVRPLQVTRKSDRGYVAILVPGHPLSHQGWVYEHRYVLYDILGSGPQECWWCGVAVNWGDNLQVDHLDNDRSNNEPGNLVPSCQPCNQGRGAGCDPKGWAVSMAARRVLRDHATEFTEEVDRIRDRLAAVPQVPSAGDSTRSAQFHRAVGAAYEEAVTGEPRGRRTRRRTA